jgi:hypothetical protein
VAILDELDGATEPGSKGVIIRREGLYGSLNRTSSPERTDLNVDRACEAAAL